LQKVGHSGKKSVEKNRVVAALDKKIAATRPKNKRTERATARRQMAASPTLPYATPTLLCGLCCPM